MKRFPKTLYITASVREDEDDEISEFFVETNKEFITEENEDTKVAVYQLVKVGRVTRKSRLVFDD